MTAQSEVFKLLIENRTRLFAFIFTAVRDHHAAEEILQNVAVVVCDKADQYQSGTSFQAWSREIARRQVLQYFRESKRGPSVLAPADLDYLTRAFDEVEKDGRMEERVQALRFCLENSPNFTRELFRFRYEEQLSLEKMADRLGLKSESVRKALYRGRIALRNCIKRRLSLSRHSHG